MRASLALAGVGFRISAIAQYDLWQVGIIKSRWTSCCPGTAAHRRQMGRGMTCTVTLEPPMCIGIGTAVFTMITIFAVFLVWRA
jgi:hypothetical protein